MLKLYKILLLILLAFLVIYVSSFCHRQLVIGDRSIIPSGKISPAMHVIQHAMGKTEIPIFPQRVVALDALILEIPLALGIKLVGLPARYLHELDFKEKQLDVEDIGSPPNIEKVMTLKPDLVLGSTDQNRDTYHLWSQIAPTILGKMESNGDWKKPFKQIATALGKTEIAHQLILEYNTRLADFRKQMGNSLQNTKVSVIRLNPPAIINLLTQDLFSGVILEDAGLSRPSSQNLTQNSKKANKRKSGSSAGYSISREKLNLVDGDILFVIAANSFKNSAEFQKALQQLQAEPLWSKLKVVKQNKVYVVGQY